MWITYPTRICKILIIVGYYRVNYDEKNWDRIIDYLNSDDYGNINRLNRAQLIDDAFNLARSGRLDYSIPFELAKYLKRETDYFPFYSYFTALNFVSLELAGSDQFDQFKVGTTQNQKSWIRKRLLLIHYSLCTITKTKTNNWIKWESSFYCTLL